MPRETHQPKVSWLQFRKLLEQEKERRNNYIAESLNHSRASKHDRLRQLQFKVIRIPRTLRTFGDMKLNV